MTTNLLVIIILASVAFLNAVVYLIFPNMRKYTAIFARILIGLVFMFSGFVKAVDPLGSEYKIHDYLSSFGMTWLLPASLVFAILLNLAEFLIGFVVFFGIRMRLFSWGTLLFMVFFTPLTLYLAIKNPVSDCGCFGDFIIFTNWETFFKNLVFITFAIIVFVHRKRFYDRMIPNWIKNLIITIGVFIGIGIQLYAVRNDAIFDFRPWKVGNRIADMVIPTPEKSEILLIYKNLTTNAEEEFTSQTLPWEDTVRMANLEFKEQRKKIIEQYKEAPIHDFIISDFVGDNYTDEYINKPEYHFILFAYDLSKTNKKSFEKINDFAKKCSLDTVSFIAITGPTPNELNDFIKEVKPNFEFFSADPTALKTVIRSNPGILLLKDGYIIDKWAHRDLPTYDEYKQNISNYDSDYKKYTEKSKKITITK